MQVAHAGSMVSPLEVILVAAGIATRSATGIASGIAASSLLMCSIVTFHVHVAHAEAVVCLLAVI